MRIKQNFRILGLRMQNFQGIYLFDDDDDDFFFVVWLINERCIALFPAGAIVGEPHHCEPPTHCKQVLNLRRT